ncbi:uncharacterized protein LOC126249286 [Schistocerca nitens]|uniref:uncharacterized protein LOC126249286 n=1 Tax=Schistocerca nitens TaxID=7011 RepID=UPI0021182E3E|nr:uncharacterized protein LOC126249286 [Schistocerca nitens]
MAQFALCLTLLAALSIIHILMEATSEEIPKLETSDDDNSNNIIQLFMYPKIPNEPCDSELKICGIYMCVGEAKENLEEDEIGSQSPIIDTTVKQVSNEDKKCFCSSKAEELFIKQEVMKVGDLHFVDYRIQEDFENGYNYLIHDWNLTVFTEIPDEVSLSVYITVIE